MLSDQNHFPSAAEYVPPSIHGYNTWPYDAGKLLDHCTILDTGANSTYAVDRRLLDDHRELYQVIHLSTLPLPRIQLVFHLY